MAAHSHTTLSTSHSNFDFSPLSAIIFPFFTHLCGTFKKLQLIEKKSDEIFSASKLLRSPRDTILTRNIPLFLCTKLSEAFLVVHHSNCVGYCLLSLYCAKKVVRTCNVFIKQAIFHHLLCSLCIDIGSYQNNFPSCESEYIFS